jgi:hypothetical protein
MAAEMLIVTGHTIDRVRSELAWAKVRDGTALARLNRTGLMETLARPRQQRQDESTPAQPQRSSSGQLGVSPYRHRSAAPSPPDDRRRRPPDG